MAATQQENAALVRRFLTNVVAGGDTDAVSVFLTEDAVDHHIVFGDETEQEGIPALGWRVLASADVTINITEVVAADDSVAVRGMVSGRHCESLVDLAPTGESFTIAYVWFCQIDDGLISEIWSFPDGLGLLQQLGAFPEVPPSRSLTQPIEHQQL